MSCRAKLAIATIAYSVALLSPALAEMPTSGPTKAPAPEMPLQVTTVTPTVPTPNQIFIAAAQRLQSYSVAPYVVELLSLQIRVKSYFDTGAYNAGGVSYPSNPYAARNPYYIGNPYPGSDGPIDYLSRYGWRESDGMENVSNEGYEITREKLPYAYVGLQFLGPFAWALRTATNVGSPSRGLSRPDIESLKSIATVTAIAKPVYDIRFIGLEKIDAHSVYHLRLRPLTNPQQHNLRELWIDAQTFDLSRARFVGFYGDAPTEITTDLVTVSGYRITSHTTWGYSAGGKSFDCSRETVKIVFVDTLPNWLFDGASYNRHYKAGEPDVLGKILEHAQTVTPLPEEFKRR